MARLVSIWGPASPHGLLASQNTIVLTSKENMSKVVAVAAPEGQLAERLKKVDVDNDVIIAGEPQACPSFDNFVDAYKSGFSPLEAAKLLRGGTATLNLTAPSLLYGVADTDDAQSADKVAKSVQQAVKTIAALLSIAKQSLATNVPEQMQATFAPLVKLADEIVGNAKVTQSGSQATLDIKRAGDPRFGGADDSRCNPAICPRGPLRRPPSPGDEQSAADRHWHDHVRNAAPLVSAGRNRQGRQADFKLAGSHSSLYSREVRRWSDFISTNLRTARPIPAARTSGGFPVAGRPQRWQDADHGFHGPGRGIWFAGRI